MKTTRTDPALGEKVRKHLTGRGIETPMKKMLIFPENAKGRKEIIEQKFADIMRILGLDLEDDSIKGTPERMARMYVDEFFYGLDYENFPKCTTVQNKMKVDEMVVVRDITVQSNCEHHFVVIDGRTQIAYIPQEKVLGLSKFNRLVDFFAKRPQIQERLTEQIRAALQLILDTEDVAVVIDATHYCVRARGVEDNSSHTITSSLGGKFREPAVRAEFFSLVER